MKLTKYIGMMLAALAFASCSDEDIASGWQNDPLAVRVNAGIDNGQTRTNPMGDVAEQKTFNVGDRLSLKDVTKNAPTIYKYNGSAWIPEDANYYLKWDAHTIKFSAYYPVQDGASQDAFTVPADQSTPEKIASADYMKCTDTEASNTSGGMLNLQLKRQMSLVNIKILRIGNEMAGKNPELKDLTLHDGVNHTITTYRHEVDGMIVYSAIVDPNTVRPETFFDIAIHYPGHEFDYKQQANTWPALKAGNSYDISVIVDTDKITIHQIELSTWTEENTGCDGEAYRAEPADNEIWAKISNHPAEIGKTEWNSSYDFTVSSTPNKLDYYVFTFPEGTTKVPDNFFRQNEKESIDTTPFALLTDVKIGKGFTQIGSYAFTNCKSLRFVKLNEGLTDICSNAFANCEKLSEIEFPTSLQNIGAFAFSSANLNKIDFDKCTNVTLSGEGIFSNNNKLKSVTLSEGCKLVGAKDMFSGCINLKDITLCTSDIDDASTGLLARTAQCNTLHIMTTFPVDNVFANMLKQGSVTKDARNVSVKIYNQNEKFDKYLWKGQQWKSVSYPIDDNCMWVKATSKPAVVDDSKYEVSTLNQAGYYEIRTVNRLPIVKIEKGIITPLTRGDINEIMLPETVQEICDEAFKDEYTNLSCIRMPETLKRIGRSAFEGCVKLQHIGIPRMTEYIGDYAFKNCDMIESIIIPESAAQMSGNQTMAYCDKLKDITTYSWLADTSASIIEGCNALDRFSYIVKGSNNGDINNWGFNNTQNIDLYVLDNIYEKPNGNIWHNLTWKSATVIDMFGEPLK